MPVTTVTTGVQYSGIWTMQQVNAAIAAGTWPSPPESRLFTWGAGSSGQLGLNNTTNYSSPKQVSTTSKWLSVAAGFYSNAGIQYDNTLWTWGRNNNGTLGQNNSVNYSSPKQVGALTNWARVSENFYSYHMLAVKTDGTLWVWGDGSFGKLGLGNTTTYSSPKQVGSLTNWLRVAANSYASFAIKTDGTMWSWGSNYNGELGQSLANTSYSNTVNSPVQIGSLTTWSSVSCGYTSAAAVKTDGTLWSWGNNANGQLGIGNTTLQSSPVQVGALTNWSTIACGGNYCLSVKTDGTLWAWGGGADGALGLGNTTSYSSPKQVGSLTTWTQAKTGYYSSGAITTSGNLYMWGQNTYGQLGLNNTVTSYSSPKQVGALTSWVAIRPGFLHTASILSA